MKRLLALLLASVALSAAPVGNTVAPDLIRKGMFSSRDERMSLRTGYEGDFVADGRMEQYEEGDGRVDCYKQYTNSGTVILNMVDRLDLYGVFGSSKTKAYWRFTLADETVHRIQLKTKYNFLWAAGARVILYEWGKTFLGMGGRYSYTADQPTSLTSDGVAVSVKGTHFHWREWQINLDLAYKIHVFTPYIGVKYSNAKSHLGNFSVPIAANGSGADSFKNRDPVGLYLGCGLSNGQYFMINLEGRLIDEEAITISADLRF